MVYGVCMTTNEINPNGYAVVFFPGEGKDPRICKGLRSHGGTVIDGRTYCIYDTADQVAEAFKRWPGEDPPNYGILPVRMLIEERPRYVLKDSAR